MIWFKFNSDLIVNEVELTNGKPANHFYPKDANDNVGFFGSSRDDCGISSDNREMLSSEVRYGNNSIVNHRKYKCYGIEIETTRKNAAIYPPLKYHKLVCKDRERFSHFRYNYNGEMIRCLHNSSRVGNGCEESHKPFSWCYCDDSKGD